MNSHLIQLHTDETKSSSKVPFNLAHPAIKTFVKIAEVALVMTRRRRRVGSWILTSCQLGRVRTEQQEGKEEGRNPLRKIQSDVHLKKKINKLR